MQQEGAATKPGTVKGVLRITRHPLFAGLALWGLAHVLVNGFLSDVVFFGGFPLFSLLGGAHQDARKQIEQMPRLSAYSRNLLMHPDAEHRRSALEWYLAVVDLAAELGASGVGGHVGAMSVTEFTAMNRAEFERYGRLIREAGIKID